MNEKTEDPTVSPEQPTDKSFEAFDARRELSKKKRGRPRKAPAFSPDLVNRLDRISDNQAALQAQFQDMLKVLHLFADELKNTAKAVRDVGNDVLDLLEATERRSASPAPIEPIWAPPVGPTAKAAPPTSPAGDLGLVSLPAKPNRPQHPKVPVPKVPVQAKPGSMEFLGDQGAFGDAMAFQDNH